MSSKKILAALALALVACKTDPPAGTSPPVPSAAPSSSVADLAAQLAQAPKRGGLDLDVCGMFTKAELKNATALDVGDGTAGRSNRSADCRWTAAGGGLVRIRLTHGGADAKDLFDAVKNADEKAAKTKPDAVAGVGDTAYFVTGLGGKDKLSNFAALKDGKTIVSITLAEVEAAKAKEAAQTIAKQALAKYDAVAKQGAK